MPTQHRSPYHALLWATTRLSDPLNVAVYAMQTMLLQPNELFHPMTRVADGNLEVHAGGRVRVVPLGRSALEVVGGQDGPLRSLLRIDAIRRWGVGEFRGMYAEEASDSTSVPLEQLGAIGIDHLLRVATTTQGQLAVLSYSGLAATGTHDEHLQVAGLIDRAVREAGLFY